MSLLSRLRRTVLPSTTSSKKVNADDGRLYNYRKPTKSFNEKSVKSRSSQSHTDHSYNDTTYRHSNAKEKTRKNSNSSSKLSKSSMLTANKSTKNKTTDLMDNATLSRSNTFTLEEEDNFQNGTYPRSKEKEKTSYRSRYLDSKVDADFDERKSNNVNKDVFETFYLKRTSKSSHSSKSSNDSIRGVDDLASSHTRPNTILTSNGKIHSSFNGKSASMRSDKYQPRQYLFGSTFDRNAKDEPEKENIYKNNHSNGNTTNANSNDDSIDDSDRFKTITINNLRRSFRDSFLNSSKPAKGREHQQLWFVDVNDKRENNGATSEPKDSIEKPCKPSNWQPINDVVDDDDDDDDDDDIQYGSGCRSRVKRNETFRIDNNDAGNERRSSALGRRETFRINKDQSPVRSIEHTPSVESNRSYALNSIRTRNNRPSNGKPIAVTAPYSASNDTDYQHSSLLSREYLCSLNDTDNNRYDTVREDSPSHYRQSSDELFSSSRDNSPIQIERPYRFKSGANSTMRTVIEIKPPQNDDVIRRNNYVSNKRNSFESRTNPERQSFNDLNTTFDRPRTNRFASLRTKLEQTGRINRSNKNDATNYDRVDDGDRHINDLYESSPLQPKLAEPWRSISSRQFSDDINTTNRSFVPYRNNINKHDEHKFTPKTSNSNRTTVNIDYNYNANTKPTQYDPVKNAQSHQHAFTIPLTATKSPTAIKPKSNKNRSVNFPSVECEVRLISPNYNTKPRRKESWRTKPANDWTFNKDIVIKEIVNGTKCTACKHLCPGFEPHLWRKTCLVCKCPRETHAIYQEQVSSVKERLGLKPTANLSTLDAKQLGYTWIPPGIMVVNKVRQYFDSLPDDKVPKINTAGERYREQQLSYQWPKQDLALNYCNHIELQNKASYEDFVAGRNEIALDIAYVKDINSEPVTCINCDDDIEQGDLAVIAPKFKDDVLWHPKCFTCSTCDELLVDLTYCVHDDKIYCERHYAEVLKPRCNACDELIFSGEYTKAMNQDWHSGHFCCWQCDETLTGQRYVLRDEHPYCIKCYENVFANTCDECNKIIGIDSKDLSYKEKHWHEACFLCNKCRVSLVDKQFGSKAEKIYCGNCYDSQFASRCDGCGEVFRAGTKKMEYKTRQWHEKCFSCCVCKNPIGTKSFIPKEQEIYCAGCYEEKYATRCIKCNKIITSGGVTYKNDPWHRECFTCTHCSASLAGQRFTSRDDKPYCADCFGELFAKRCTSCIKPITGIGGTRFISFEDRHWHNDCFICASCKTSLVGRGFITDEADIICPECAKARLM